MQKHKPLTIVFIIALVMPLIGSVLSWPAATGARLIIGGGGGVAVLAKVATGGGGGAITGGGAEIRRRSYIIFDWTLPRVQRKIVKPGLGGVVTPLILSI